MDGAALENDKDRYEEHVEGKKYNSSKKLCTKTSNFITQ